ncbi:MAG: ATP-binding cassette domain-containing protein [Acidobacteria bacterium]|nr:ATP-binding cassette domain-containing protein [Acidobacteriota bacterium]
MSNAGTLADAPIEQRLEHGDLLAHDAVPAALISMRDIWKTYQMGSEELHALRGVSFDVQRGEYVAIIGPSGSGKSTLMNLIGCLDTPSQGRYWINSKLVSDMDDDELAPSNSATA